MLTTRGVNEVFCGHIPEHMYTFLYKGRLSLFYKHVITLYICVLVHCLPQLECKNIMKVAALFALFIAVCAVLRTANSKCLKNIY